MPTYKIIFTLVAAKTYEVEVEAESLREAQDEAIQYPQDEANYEGWSIQDCQFDFIEELKENG